MIKANFEWLCKQNHIAPTTAAKDVDGRRSTRRHKDDGEIVRVPGGVPRIVSDETFARVQQMFEKRKHLMYSS